MTYAKSFLPLWIRILQISLDALIVVGGMLWAVTPDEMQMRK